MADSWSPDAVIVWLIEDGRLIKTAAGLARALGERLLAEGAPVWRIRFAPHTANPLLSAWGVVWRRGDAEATEYQVPHGTERSPMFVGSPFQYVIEHRRPLRRRLVDLNPATDHEALHDVARAGGTDFLALPLVFSDGSSQGISLVTDSPSGFDDHDIAGLTRVIAYLTPVVEILARERSTASLLRTYLGRGPSAAVLAGAVMRGDAVTMEAAVLVTDLRGFTAKSQAWTADALLQALDAYFEAICDAAEAHGGDVLKFMGDGVLAIFPVSADVGPAASARNALAATRQAHATLAETNRTRAADGFEPLSFVAGLHIGALTYGNIGGRDRLDFTVIGPSVNVASRLQDLCKKLDAFGLTTEAVADLVGEPLAARGRHTLRSVAGQTPVFEFGPS